MIIAAFGYEIWYQKPKGGVFIKDEAKVASRVGGIE